MQLLRIVFDLQEGKILLGAHETSSFPQPFLSNYLAEEGTEPDYKLPVFVLRIVRYHFYIGSR